MQVPIFERVGLPVLILVFVFALALRVVDLAGRPMHTDEAVQGMKFIQLLEGEGYVYDPSEFHGPTLYYLTLPLARIAGQRTGAELSETTLRLLPVLFSLALIPMLALWRRIIGWQAVCWAALFIAVSPINIYYARYYIQETLLVFFFFAFLTCSIRYAYSRRTAWVMAAGISAGLMHATKETSALMFAALAGAVFIVYMSRPAKIRKRVKFKARDIPWRQLIGGASAAAVVSVTLYSSFFSNIQGVADSVVTYFHFADRATGQGHEKPWFTHLQWIGWHKAGGFVWTELFLLMLASMGVMLSLDWRAICRRLLGINSGYFESGRSCSSRAVSHPFAVSILGGYAIVIIAVYSVIPYKTPWLMLSPMQIAAVLAGVGASRLVMLHGSMLWKVVVIVALGVGTAHLGMQAYRAAFFFAADERVPYAYSHTSPDAVRVSERILRMAEMLEDSERVVQVAAAEYWPLPWYLRSLERVGYWNEMPAELFAPIIVLDPALSTVAESSLKGEYVPQMTGLRPGVFITAWYRSDLWEHEIRKTQ